MQEENIIAKDGGYASRKLLFAMFTSVMIVVSALVVGAPVLDAVIYGLVATAGIYITGNVMTKWKASGIEEAKLQLPKPAVKPAAKPAPKADDVSD